MRDPWCSNHCSSSNWSSSVIDQKKMFYQFSQISVYIFTCIAEGESRSRSRSTVSLSVVPKHIEGEVQGKMKQLEQQFYCCSSAIKELCKIYSVPISLELPIYTSSLQYVRFISMKLLNLHKYFTLLACYFRFHRPWHS